MSTSLFSQYIKERGGKEIVESNKGFATYFYVHDGCYIEDIYVHPDHRKLGVASEFADAVATLAKEKGYSRLYGSVCPTANGSTSSLKVLLAYGFNLHSAANNSIVMVKEI